MNPIKTVGKVGKMKITKKTSYGVRLMLRLSVSFEEEYIGLKEIADRESIPFKFLENIVSSLKKEGLVNVRRGSAGGYMLSKRPEEISLKEIFEVFEGRSIESEGEIEEEASAKVTHIIWSELNLVIHEYLQSKSLKDLEIELKKDSKDHMFYI